MLEDPRARPDFRPEHFPTANGKSAPSPDGRGPNDQKILEFLSVYYRLNCEHAKLLESRGMADSAGGPQTERERMQAIERILVIRDGLEDQYAPMGTIAEPVVRGGFTVDVKFTFGNVNRAGRLRGAAMVSSATIPIRLPPGVRIEDLTLPEEQPPVAGQ
ncbi:MAG: hypothetical protein L0Y58_13680 [Verrucomicrobia subdivision 3 bacterium]|nr:hypothetical protein [Limisphaerales bacterium]